MTEAAAASLFSVRPRSLAETVFLYSNLKGLGIELRRISRDIPHHAFIGANHSQERLAYIEQKATAATGKFIMVIQKSDLSCRHVIGANLERKLIFDPAVPFAMHEVKNFTRFCTSDGIPARGIKAAFEKMILPMPKIKGQKQHRRKHFKKSTNSESHSSGIEK